MAAVARRGRADSVMHLVVKNTQEKFSRVLKNYLYIHLETFMQKEEISNIEIIELYKITSEA